MQVGMTKDQGLYNKPSAAVYPGALAAGTLPQYYTINCQINKLRWGVFFVLLSNYKILFPAVSYTYVIESFT